MTTAIQQPGGVLKRGMKRDSEGNRTYTVTFLVVSDDKGDGPTTALNTVGIPRPGEPWFIGNDYDAWAFCTLDADVEQVEEPGVSLAWKITLTFTSKPWDKRCKEEQNDDPLMIPDRVSGDFVTYSEEATHDRFGRQITTSAFEQIRGSQVEFDANRASVKIEQNVLDLQLFLLSSIGNSLNDAPLWGMPARTVKLSDISWSRKYYGSCYKYYTRTLGFDIRADGFDRDILDEGNKCLHGQWNQTTGQWQTIKIGGQDPNPANPAHYTQFKDRKGQPTKCILDGRGKPFNPTVPVVKTCSQCGSDGALQTWTLIGTKDGTRHTVTLTYDTGCTWRGNHPTTGSLFTLSYVSADGQWKIVDATAGNAWFCVQQDFNCLGPVPFENLAPGTSTTYPESWIGYAQLTSQPGNRHVEKYDDANFLLLGIPTEL